MAPARARIIARLHLRSVKSACRAGLATSGPAVFGGPAFGNAEVQGPTETAVAKITLPAQCFTEPSPSFLCLSICSPFASPAAQVP